MEFVTTEATKFVKRDGDFTLKKIVKCCQRTKEK